VSGKPPRWEVLPSIIRQMLGDPLRWTDDEIAYLATLTPREAERFIEQYDRDSRYPGLLGGDEDRKYTIIFASGGAWYWARLRADGTPGPGIPWRRIRFDIDNKLIRASMRRTGAMTERLISGEMNLADWQAAMAREVKYINSVGAFLADGGPENLGVDAASILREQLTSELKYLDNFANQLADGKAPLNRRSVNRAKMYSKAGRSTYERVRRNVAGRYNFDEERRYLGAADHCDCCIIEADRGWQPIGSLIPIGACTCGPNCQCIVVYRNSETGDVWE